MLGFDANAVSIQSVVVKYTNGTLVPSTVTTAPTTANTVNTFQEYQFAAAPLNTWNQRYDYQVVVTTTSAFAGNTAINFWTNDEPDYIQNGQLISSAAYGGTNQKTHADLVLPLVNYGVTSEYNGITNAGGPIELYFKR